VRAERRNVCWTAVLFFERACGKWWRPKGVWGIFCNASIDVLPDLANCSSWFLCHDMVAVCCVCNYGWIEVSWRLEGNHAPVLLCITCILFFFVPRHNVACNGFFAFCHNTLDYGSRMVLSFFVARFLRRKSCPLWLNRFSDNYGECFADPVKVPAFT